VTVVKIETPREYFDNVVELDVKDFIDEPTDLRRAYHACISILSLRDWIVKTHNSKRWLWQTKDQGLLKSKKQLQEALNVIDKSFEITTDIANASKHMVLEPDRRQTNLYGSANVEIMTVTSSSAGALVGTAIPGGFLLNQAPLVFSTNRIRVKIDSTYFDVLTCVVTARAIWVSLLQENSW